MKNEVLAESALTYLPVHQAHILGVFLLIFLGRQVFALANVAFFGDLAGFHLITNGFD